MSRQAFAKELKKLPDAPGVYFFLARNKKILYIGRATSLRNRVRSYFAPDIAEKRSQWIAKMLPLIKRIDFRRTDSVLEAVLLEADLIKKSKPLYNTDFKDDRSFNCVVITKEDFPAVFITRQRNVDFNGLKLTTLNLQLKTIYGPFPNGFELQTALKIIRRIFPYRDQRCKPLIPPLQKEVPSLRGGGFKSLLPKTTVLPLGKGELKTGKPCFNRQIGLCPGTCTGEISKAEYAKSIRNIQLFFEGKKARLLKLLQKEMKAVAKAQEFEKAGELKRQLFALQHIQDIALLRRENAPPSIPPLKRGEGKGGGFRVEAYDLSHFGGKEIGGAMAVVEDGIARPSEYRLFKLRSITGPHETAGLSEILRRRLNHPEWPFPQLIVVDGNEVQKKAAEAVLVEVRQKIPVVAVVKDERHRPREILGLQDVQDWHLPARTVREDANQMILRESAVLLANSEVHRFVLRFQRKQRMLQMFPANIEVRLQ